MLLPRSYLSSASREPCHLKSGIQQRIAMQVSARCRTSADVRVQRPSISLNLTRLPSTSNCSFSVAPFAVAAWAARHSTDTGWQKNPPCAGPTCVTCTCETVLNIKHCSLVGKTAGETQLWCIKHHASPAADNGFHHPELHRSQWQRRLLQLT